MASAEQMKEPASWARISTVRCAAPHGLQFIRLRQEFRRSCRRKTLPGHPQPFLPRTRPRLPARTGWPAVRPASSKRQPLHEQFRSWSYPWPPQKLRLRVPAIRPQPSFRRCRCFRRYLARRHCRRDQRGLETRQGRGRRPLRTDWFEFSWFSPSSRPPARMVLDYECEDSLILTVRYEPVSFKYTCPQDGPWSEIERQRS